MKKLFYVLALALMLTGCAKNEGANQAITEEKAESAAAYVYENEGLKVSADNGKATIEGESEFATKNAEKELSENELALGTVIDSIYKDNYSVRFNPAKFEFTLKANGDQNKTVGDFINDISNGENTLTAEWDAFKKEMADTSMLFKNFEGARKPVIRVINPFNAHNIVLAFQNGEAKYDFSNELVGDSLQEGIDENEEISGLE